jgi:hypothetical protein
LNVFKLILEYFGGLILVFGLCYLIGKFLIKDKYLEIDEDDNFDLKEDEND